VLRFEQLSASLQLLEPSRLCRKKTNFPVASDQRVKQGNVRAAPGHELSTRPGSKYCTRPIFAFWTHQACAGHYLAEPRHVHIRNGVNKGITAHYLLHSTYAVGPGSVVLLYGAAGGQCQFLALRAKALGAFVIGVVSKARSIERAQATGCDAVLVWGACNLPSEVARLTDGQKAHVVYDGIGKPTFVASLDSLRSRGMMVSIGASGGAPDPVAVGILNAKGSPFLTRPGVAAHATDPAEYRHRADAVFAAVTAGVLKPETPKVFPLADAAAAHAALEEGNAGGAILLKP
jgi:NADPH:quinone reductase-like Zn-dependent oxidoreductase